MKKWLAVLLAVVMLCGTVLPVWAEEAPSVQILEEEDAEAVEAAVTEEEELPEAETEIEVPEAAEETADTQEEEKQEDAVPAELPVEDAAPAETDAAPAEEIPSEEEAPAAEIADGQEEDAEAVSPEEAEEEEADAEEEELGEAIGEECGLNVDAPAAFEDSGLLTERGVTSFTGSFNGRYGNQLLAQAKDVYNAAVKKWVTNKQTGAVTVTFSTPLSALSSVASTSQSEVRYAVAYGLAALEMDHPELFWIDSWSWSTNTPSQSNPYYSSVTITPVECSSGISSNRSTFEGYRNSAVADIKASYSSGANRFTIVKAIHDYVVNNLTFASGSGATYKSAWSLFGGNGNALTQGFAKAFKVLCDQLSIPCVCVCGKRWDDDQGQYLTNMYNYVKMDDNKWYLVDTARDQGYGVKLYLLTGNNESDGEGGTIGNELLEDPTCNWSGSYVPKLVYPKRSNVRYVGIKLSSTSKTMTVGTSSTLSYTLYSAYTSGETVTWSSSQTAVATVSSAGKVTAKSVGTTVITAKTRSGSTAKCTVKVIFKDVADNTAIYWGVNNGIVAGFADGTFRPSDPCTRAQVVLFLWRAAGRPEPKSTTLKFKDNAEINKLAPDYKKAIAWGCEKNIVVGFTGGANAGKFKPNDPCTRAQIVMFIWRYKGRPSTSATISFKDVAKIKALAPDYIKAITWAVAKGITQGFEDNTFRPNTNCTRQQTVTFLYRAVK